MYNYGNYNNSNNNSNGNIIKVIICFIAFVALVIAALVVPNMIEGKKTYTATFMDLDGVYLVEENLKKNSTLNEPTPPTKSGYKFLGWYLEEVLYDFSTPVKSDIYLRAKWLNNDTKKIEEASKPSTVKPTSTPSTVKPTSTPSTVKPTPKPTTNPTPTPSNTQPRPTQAPQPQRRNYTITVVNGEGSGTYPEGSVITITATAGATTISDWKGDTSEKEGNVRYKEQTSTNFKRWSDGNTDQSRTISVNGNATYTAEYETVTTKINKQKYTIGAEKIYGYPTKILFYVQHSSGYAAEGNILETSATICKSTSNKCVSYITPKSFNNPGYQPDSTSSSGGGLYISDYENGVSWKWTSSSSVDWDVLYNRQTGVVRLSSNKKASSSRTVKFDITYSNDETKFMPRDAEPISSVSQAYLLTSYHEFANDQYKGKDPVNISLQLKKVIVQVKNAWVDM